MKYAVFLYIDSSINIHIYTCFFFYIFLCFSNSSFSSYSVRVPLDSSFSFFLLKIAVQEFEMAINIINDGDRSPRVILREPTGSTAEVRYVFSSIMMYIYECISICVYCFIREFFWRESYMFNDLF